MKFKITSKTLSGNFTHHIFDNITLDIINEHGIPVVLKNDPRCKKLITSQPDTRIGKIKEKGKIKNLRISLGFNCNFHCKYCIEHRATKDDQKVIRIHKDLDTRARNLVDRIAENFPNLKTVTFWGGEPLVYFKLLKRITEILKERLPKVGISTITNGSLITLDKAKWLVDNGVSVTISHDGPSFNVYRDDLDPLDDPRAKEGILYLIHNSDKDYTGFNIVVSPENSDLQKLVPFFEKKLGVVPKISFESTVVLDKDTAGIITPFDDKTTATLLNNIVAYGSTPDNKHDYASIRDRTTQVLKSLISQHPLSDLHCMIDSHSFAAIDTNGKVLICHGGKESYCDIEDIDKIPFPTKLLSWKHRKECLKCPFLVGCLGGCPLKSIEDHKYVCKNMKIWYSGIFIAAWKILFNCTICKIEPYEEEQDVPSTNK